MNDFIHPGQTFDCSFIAPDNPRGACGWRQGLAVSGAGFLDHVGRRAGSLRFVGLNQYIDRELDKKMQRTSNRPLAAGRMTAAEGLSYGLALCLLSYYILAGFVNLTAALLSLAGIFYYVIFYSVLLKKVDRTKYCDRRRSRRDPADGGLGSCYRASQPCGMDTVSYNFHVDAASLLGFSDCSKK